jgi:hypothetical protein
MLFRRRRDHEVVRTQLDKQEQEAEEMKKRVRLLEIEAGIFRPQLKEVNGT